MKYVKLLVVGCVGLVVAGSGRLVEKPDWLSGQCIGSNPSTGV